MTVLMAAFNPLWSAARTIGSSSRSARLRSRLAGGDADRRISERRSSFLAGHEVMEGLFHFVLRPAWLEAAMIHRAHLVYRRAV